MISWRTPAGSASPDGRPIEAQPKWRRDFPIDRPEDHFVSRRDFTRFMILTSAAFVAGQFWIALLNIWRRGRGRPPVQRIAASSDIPVGGVLSFQYPDPSDHALLIRQGENHFVAFHQACTHLACAVQPQPEAGRFRCPCHEGYFDLASGQPISGPPRRPLPKVLLEVRGGHVYATGLEVRT